MARTKTVTVGGTDYQLQSVTYSWYSNLTDLYINPANGRKPRSTWTLLLRAASPHRLR